MSEPKCLTRMKLSECWGDNLNVEELKEVNAYIEKLQQENKQLKEELDKEKDDFKEFVKLGDKGLKESINNLEGTQFLDAFCVLQWINVTRKENQHLKNDNTQIRNNNKELKRRLKSVQEKRDSYKFRYRDVCKQLKQRDEVIAEAAKELKRGIIFCKNDSQDAYDICNIAINRAKKVFDILNKYKGDNNEQRRMYVSTRANDIRIATI